MEAPKVYSFKKGLIKGVVSLLSVGLALLTFSGFANLHITELIQQYLFPLIGSLTIGGALTVFINWLKIKYAL